MKKLGQEEGDLIREKQTGNLKEIHKISTGYEHKRNGSVENTPIAPATSRLRKGYIFPCRT